MFNPNDFNNKNDIIKILMFIDGLLKISILMIGVGFFGSLMIVNNDYLKGELMGICIMSLFLFCAILTLFRSMISDEEIEEMRRQIKEDLDKQMREFEERHKKRKDKKDGVQQDS